MARRSHSVVGIRVVTKLDNVVVLLVRFHVAFVLLVLLVLSMLMMVLFARAAQPTVRASVNSALLDGKLGNTMRLLEGSITLDGCIRKPRHAGKIVQLVAEIDTKRIECKVKITHKPGCYCQRF